MELINRFLGQGEPKKSTQELEREGFVYGFRKEMQRTEKIADPTLRAEIVALAIRSFRFSGDWYTAIEDALRTYYTEDEPALREKRAS